MFCKCDELKKKKKTIRKALKALDKENFVLIMHGSSFPAVDGENTGFGTMNSNAVKLLLIMLMVCLMLSNLDQQVKQRAVILHLIQVLYSQVIHYLLI